MILFDGIGAEVVTMKNYNAVVGAPCCMLSNGTVYGAEDSDVIHGVCLWERDGLVGVQVRGFVTLPLSSAAPEVGYAKLAASGTGGVKVSSSGREYLIVAVDSTAKTVTFMM